MSDGLDTNRFPVSMNGQAMGYNVARIAEEIRQKGPMVLSCGGSDEEHLRYVWVANYANPATGQIKGMGPSAPPYNDPHYGMVPYEGPEEPLPTTQPPPPPPPPPSPPPQPGTPGVLEEWEVEGLRKWWQTVEARLTAHDGRLSALENRGPSAGP